MKRIRKKFRDMKYRHKLTILLVISSLVPMTMLALYSHNSMSRLVRHNEVEDTSSILEQTRESIDSQIEVYTGLINYLTYSPDIEEVINEKNMDNYVAYAKYTQIVDPLLTVPKSYHDAINQIQIFADSIKVRHEYTLVPMDEIGQEWWSSQLNDEVQVQWLVNTEKPEIAAVRNIYDGRNRTAVLCITLDYNKIFKPLKNIISDESGTMVLDQSQNIVYRDENIQDNDLADLRESDKILEQISKEYVAVNSTSQNTGWKFYLYKTKKSVEKSVYQMLLAEIPLIAGCVLIIFILGMAFSRLFTRKIEMLTENMDQVNHGSREVTVTSDAEDEVGVLIRSFRRMMGEIDRLISEVYENKIALKEFELKALTAQINPHFLYNSLSIINWMAIKSGQKEISKVTLDLSTFYRTALSKGEDMVTVENCIRNIEAYLSIQLVMHDNDFTVEWKIDPQVKAEKVPKLILQPVVENALEHGLDVKEEGDKILQLSFLDAGDAVLLRVEDNGMGMEQSVAESLVTYQAEGYGLKNVNDRICLLYGEEYKIRITSSVGKGTVVEMRIPKGETL
ncbi:cache domain-containing sensor histidine kinase [Blautia luti]|uniref:cache domain-containing sensor histidine kinase n=1 Tax=Blautia luti TaxID=89014 RepID=UPI0018AB64EA|nr:sensor histidine kinase [Blautia luti]